MYNFRAVVDLPVHGSTVIFFDYHSRELPTSGQYSGYCPAGRGVVSFQFQNVVEANLQSVDVA